VRIHVNAPSDGHLLGLTRRSDDPGNDTRLVKKPATSMPDHIPFVQVRPIGGIGPLVGEVYRAWRRYNVTNNVRVWQSDHASMEDALANTGVLGVELTDITDEVAKLDRSNTIAQRADQ